MTVKELIQLLLEFDTNSTVYVGLGNLMIPSGCAEILEVKSFVADIRRESGVYLITREPIDITN
jgi:hypothetical protein